MERERSVAAMKKAEPLHVLFSRAFRDLKSWKKSIPTRHLDNSLINSLSMDQNALMQALDGQQYPVPPGVSEGEIVREEAASKESMTYALIQTGIWASTRG